MEEIRTLEQFKKQLKYTSRDKILEMFYNQGLMLIKIIKEGIETPLGKELQRILKKEDEEEF